MNFEVSPGSNLIASDLSKLTFIKLLIVSQTLYREIGPLHGSFEMFLIITSMILISFELPLTQSGLI